MVTEASSTVFPIAKDMKIQVEFNPSVVSEYRLIGYEKRLLRREDFNNDKVDAGDIGSGHTVTAIYEITPVGSTQGMAMDELRYSTVQVANRNVNSGFLEQIPQMMTSSDGNSDEASKMQEYAFLKIRYKLPNDDTSKLFSKPITQEDEVANMDNDKLVSEFRFAMAVAGFAHKLKVTLGGTVDNSSSMSYEKIMEVAESSAGEDKYGYRKEFISLVRTCKDMTRDSLNYGSGWRTE